MKAFYQPGAYCLRLMPLASSEERRRWAARVSVRDLHYTCARKRIHSGLQDYSNDNSLSHPGSFRCSYHKRLDTKQKNRPALPSIQSLVRIGGVEGELVKPTLTTLIRPSPH
ncbi:hypothetical protein K1719_002402 [Acacia pycnantha]|nr:hypothetical protein K1719_002402 [Acacia pycnantha]